MIQKTYSCHYRLPTGSEANAPAGSKSAPPDQAALDKFPAALLHRLAVDPNASVNSALSTSGGQQVLIHTTLSGDEVGKAVAAAIESLGLHGGDLRAAD